MRFAFAFVLACVAVPVVAAQSAGEPLISVVVYHPAPDPAAGSPRADPFAAPLAPSDRLPRTEVDGVLVASDAPGGDPSSTSAHFLELRRLVQERARGAVAPPMEVSGAFSAGEVRVRVSYVGGGEVRGVLVEDGLEHDGDSGVRVHRFVARAFLNGTGGDLRAPLDPSWRVERLAVVVWAEGKDGVEQSATWRGADVRQVGKAVLVEHWTATWCAPCGPSDHALALFASQSGLPLDHEEHDGYARPPSVLLVAGLVLGAGAGVALVRRRG